MNHRLHMLCHSRAHPLCQTHTDTSRLSSPGSEGSPELRNAKDDRMSFPPRPRRWSDTIVDVGDSWHRRRGCYVTWLENWMKTKARDLKNTHVRTHTHGSRNRLHFPCYSVSILSPGSALPSGRVNRCVCVCVHVLGSGKGLQLAMDVHFLPSDAFASKNVHGRLLCIFPRVHCVHLRGEPGGEPCANQVSLFQVWVSKPHKPRVPQASGVCSRLGERIRLGDQCGTFRQYIKEGLGVFTLRVCVCEWNVRKGGKWAHQKKRGVSTRHTHPRPSRCSQVCATFSKGNEQGEECRCSVCSDRTKPRSVALKGNTTRLLSARSQCE